MEKDISVSVNINPKFYKKICEIIGYSKVTKMTKDADLPTTENEVINAALFHYFKRIDTINSFHNIDRRALNLEEGTKVQNRFKEVLKMIGMKQKELAELTGIDDATISTILSNRNQPSMEYFLRIWTVLGCPPIEDVFYREKS